MLSASIPLSMAYVSTFAIVLSSNRTVIDPPPSMLLRQQVDDEEVVSIHVLAFSSHGDLLVAESEGEFDPDVWEEVHDGAKKFCCSSRGRSSHGEGEEEMDIDDAKKEEGLEDKLRDAVGTHVRRELGWKEGER